MRTRLDEGFPWAGLAVGPAAWAVSTQANYSLVPIVCSHGLPVWIVPALAAALVVATLASGLVSWRAWQRLGTGEQDSRADGRPRNLLAGVGTLSALLFALVIAAQGSAALVLHGCER